MAENIEVMEEAVEEKNALPFVETAHRILLASIGAVAVAQEELEAFVNRLVERGEIAEKDGRRMLSDVVERRRNGAGKAAEKAQSTFDRRIEDVLERLNVPSKNDIEALSKKLNTLSRKVDQLRKAQEKAEAKPQ